MVVDTLGRIVYTAIAAVKNNTHRGRKPLAK